MKGIVFTEFLEMVEEKFGMQIADEIVTQSNLPSQGIYTAVGTYDHSEMVTLVVKLSQASGVSVPDLLKTYGRHLFSRFSQVYGAFFKDAHDTFTFLASIESYIHVEVRKLYPDAELPRFDIYYLNTETLEMIYESERGMADFAEGLIQGCILHFQENITIQREDLSANKHQARFTLSKTAA